MKIVCKVKDYYDYLSGVNGIDPLVVYDRREYAFLTNTDTIPVLLRNQLYFDKIDSDKKKQKITKSKSARRFVNKDWYFNKEEIFEGNITYFCIVVGYKRYLIECERYLDDKDKLCLDYTVLENTDIPKDERIFKNYPILIHTCERGFFGSANSVPFYSWFNIKKAIKENNVNAIKQHVIFNPIFKDTPLTSIISPEEMWDNIYSFISSLNEKDITDKRDDNGHIISHGFSTKESFRNINHRLK